MLRVSTLEEEDRVKNPRKLSIYEKERKIVMNNL
jgi:hypothetical protein